MVGTPKATAKNLGPESVVTSSRLRRMQALVRPIDNGSSARLTTRGSSASCAIRRDMGRSSGAAGH